jgi:hypothetical protein
MKKMDAAAVRTAAAMRELSLHLRFPVELRSPIIANLLEEGEVESVIPIGAADLVWLTGSA